MAPVWETFKALVEAVVEEEVMVAASEVPVYVWVKVPVPEVMVRFLFAEMVTPPAAVNNPVPVVMAPLPVVCKDKVLLPMSQVEAAAPVRFKAPAEVTARVPEVAVAMVKFPEVLVQEEVPPEARVMAPVELPMPTVFPPVAARVTFPETFNPPVPWI